jgi:hypothetical protein
MIVAWWRVPVRPNEEEGALDYLGSALLITTLATLILAVVEPDAGWRFVGLSSVSALSAIAFVWREQRFSTPILPLGLFVSRSFAGANIMTSLFYAALSGTLYFLPFNLIQVQGYSATEAGLAFLPMTLLLAFGSIFAGGVIRRYHPRSVLTLGPLVAALGMFLLGASDTDASYLRDFLPATLIMGLGMMMCAAPLTTLVMGAVADGQAGIASGINNTVARLAGVIAVSSLTPFAIDWFAAALDTRLRTMGVPEAVIESLVSRAALLAALEGPGDVDESIIVFVDAAVSGAYADTFRRLVTICGVLAVSSGVIAWLAFKGRSPHVSDPPSSARREVRPIADHSMPGPGVGAN